MPRATTAKTEMAASSESIAVIKAELFKALATRPGFGPGGVVRRRTIVGDIQPLVGLELSHLSHQLAVLRRAGLVTSRKEGSSVIYAVKDELVAELLRVAKQLLINSLAETTGLLTGLRSPSS